MKAKYNTPFESLMIKKGLTPADIHKNTGISYSLLNKYISGKRKPKIENSEKIAKMLDIDISSLHIFF